MATWGEDPETGEWTWIRVTEPLATPFDDWAADAVYVLAPGRPILAELRIRPVALHVGVDADPGNWWEDDEVRRTFVEGGPRGVVTRVLRAVKPASLEHRMRGDLHELLYKTGRSTPKEIAAEAASKVVRRRGRAIKGDAHYALWAARYVEHLASDKPVAEVARKYRKRPQQVRDLIRQARVRGLLTETTRGRSDGELTEKGVAALAAITTTGGRDGVDQEEPT